MSNRVRHWKQHWDPDAPLMFIRRLALGIKGHEVVNPGDPVTPGIIAGLGKNPKARLKRWWEAKFLAIKDWKAPDEVQRARNERQLPPTRPELEHLGRGWILVRFPDGKTTKKVRGQKAADALLAQFDAAAAAAPTA